MRGMVFVNWSQGGKVSAIIRDMSYLGKAHITMLAQNIIMFANHTHTQKGEEKTTTKTNTLITGHKFPHFQPQCLRD